MSTDTKPTDVGQANDTRPISANEARLWMREVHRLSRLIEAYLDRPDPPDADEKTFVDESPPLALRCDGKILINLGELQGVDLQRYGCELWTGVVLSDTAASDVVDHLADGFQGAAGIVGADIIKRAKRAQGEEE